MASRGKWLSFESSVEKHDGVNMHVIPVPGEIGDQLPADCNRMLVEIGGRELRRSLQARKTGQPYLLMGKTHLDALELQLGDSLSARIAPDPEPDHLEIAEELLEALRQDPEAKERWDEFTVGFKRSLNLYVDTAKRLDTRARRAAELVEKIRTRTLHNDG
jgi:hypothetical protein